MADVVYYNMDSMPDTAEELLKIRQHCENFGLRLSAVEVLTLSVIFIFEMHTLLNHQESPLTTSNDSITIVLANIIIFSE